MLKTVLLVFLALLDLIASQDSFSGDHKLNHNPKSYVLNKFKTRDIVLLGTRHKQTPLLEFISEIIAVLHNSGVTHIGLEIATDQQGKINRFVETGAGLSEIQIHPQINCR